MFHDVRQLAGIQLGVPSWSALRRPGHAMRLLPLGSHSTDVPSAQNVEVAIVVRLGPLPLLQRRAGRLVELERIVGEPVDLIEVSSVADLTRVLTETDVLAVVLDAPAPGDLAGAAEAAGRRPVLRPLWRSVRNSRGETDGVFDGYGRLTSEAAVERLADGALARP